MVHFTCDICGCHLDDRRFVARLEVYPALDPDDITDADVDRNNLDELAEILNDMELTGNLELDQNTPKAFRYDLCPDCHKQFIKDPLALHRPRRLRVSEN